MDFFSPFLCYIFISLTFSSLKVECFCARSGTYLPRHRNANTSMSAKKGSSEKVRGLDVQPPRPNDNTYWITNNFIAGEYPADARGEEQSRIKIRQYLDLGITFFVDLTREGEKAGYETMLKEESSKKGLTVGYRRLPVQDFGIPKKGEMKTILDTIDSEIAKQGKVYVHCRGGIGRTGTTVGCFLARHGNNGDEALDEVNRLFQNSNRSYESSCSPETVAQENFVRQWSE